VASVNSVFFSSSVFLIFGNFGEEFAFAVVVDDEVVTRLKADFLVVMYEAGLLIVRLRKDFAGHLLILDMVEGFPECLAQSLGSHLLFGGEEFFYGAGSGAAMAIEADRMKSKRRATSQ
jgi:hypothetical protein